MAPTKAKAPGRKPNGQTKAEYKARQSKKRAARDADDYDSDGGFVEDDAEKEGPKAKKVKGIHPKAESHAGGSGRGTTTGEIPGDGGVDDQGSEFWELSGKRRVTISEFPKGQGKYAINLREYYEKGDQMLPGKKGILLPMEQFNALIEMLPHIEMVLKGKGVGLARPNYQAAGAEDTMKEEHAPTEEQGRDEDEEGDVGVSKKNFEATSEEEDEEDVNEHGEPRRPPD